MTYILAEGVINWSTFISFLLGIITGASLLVAILAIVIANGKKESKKIYGPKAENLTEEKIKDLIRSKQNAFSFEVEENEADYFKTVMKLGVELLHEVSSYYYPNSKYPEYELTVIEATELIHYITNHIALLFDKPILNNIKNVRISTITSIIDKTKKVTKPVKAITDSGADEAYGAYRTAANILNPVYWFRKIVLKGTINLAIKKICKAGLAIVGEESNKVYSKNLFKESVDEAIKKDIEEIYNDEGDDNVPKKKKD